MSDTTHAMITDFYQLLGLTPNANLEQIQAAYQGVMQQFHPDQLPPGTPEYLRKSAQERLDWIRKAYEVLRDPDQKAAYDAELQDIAWSQSHAFTQLPQFKKPSTPTRSSLEINPSKSSAIASDLDPKVPQVEIEPSANSTPASHLKPEAPQAETQPSTQPDQISHLQPEVSQAAIKPSMQPTAISRLEPETTQVGLNTTQSNPENTQSDLIVNQSDPSGAYIVITGPTSLPWEAQSSPSPVLSILSSEPEDTLIVQVDSEDDLLDSILSNSSLIMNQPDESVIQSYPVSTPLSLEKDLSDLVATSLDPIPPESQSVSRLSEQGALKSSPVTAEPQPEVTLLDSISVPMVDNVASSSSVVKDSPSVSTARQSAASQLKSPARSQQAPVASRTTVSKVPWIYLVISGCVGSAFTLLVLGLGNLLFQPQSGQLEAQTSVAPVPAINPADAIATLTPPPANIQPTQKPSQSNLEPSLPNQDQIENFVKAQIEVNRVLEATDRQLASAVSETDRQAIEQEFELAATKLITANGLTTEEYQWITFVAQQNPTIQSKITQIALELQNDL